jgi:hypothetical protein
MIVAGCVLLVTIILVVGPLTTGGGDHPIDNTDPRALTPALEVTPAQKALDPLVEQVHEGMPSESPFTLRKTTRSYGPRIPLPPPPPLDLPPPPLMPLAEARP